MSCIYISTYLPLLILMSLHICTSLGPSAAVRASRTRSSSSTHVTLLLLVQLQLLFYTLWSSPPKFGLRSNLYECVCMYALAQRSRYPHCRRHCRRRDHQAACWPSLSLRKPGRRRKRRTAARCVAQQRQRACFCCCCM